MIAVASCSIDGGTNFLTSLHDKDLVNGHRNKEKVIIQLRCLAQLIKNYCMRYKSNLVYHQTVVAQLVGAVI